MENFERSRRSLRFTSSSLWLTPRFDALQVTIRIASAPDLFRGIGDKFQLRPLLSFVEEIAFSRRSETTLRTDGEIFQRNESRGFFHAACEIVDGFQMRDF
jgi:hypothetical protein